MNKFYYFAIILFYSFGIHAQATDFVTGLNNPRDMLLDGSTLYVAESYAGRIIKLDLLQSNPEPEVVVSGIPLVNGMALRGTELYFSQLNGYNKLSKIDLTDPNPSPIVILEDFISAMDLEFYGDYLYISQFALDRIVKIDPSIPNPPIIEVVTGVETAHDLEIVGDEMYVVVWAYNKISKIDLTVQDPILVDVKTNLSLAVGMKLRSNELYIAEAGQSIGDDRVSMIDITQTNPVRETIVTGLYNPTQGLEIYNDVLYIAEDFKISKFELSPLAVAEYKISHINVYPNPSSDFIRLSGLPKQIPYSLYSLSGTFIKSGLVEDGDNINIKDLSAGTYLLVLDKTWVVRVLKE